MCNMVVINKGEKEISTPRQFLEHFGFMPDPECYHSITMDECLCNCEIGESFRLNNIEYRNIDGDYYVDCVMSY